MSDALISASAVQRTANTEKRGLQLEDVKFSLVNIRIVGLN